MRILIGGSPSTGSSVLRQVINRHPALFCGPETSLFCYPTVYKQWSVARRRLLRKGRLGVHHTEMRHLRGVHLVDPEFGWSVEEVRKLAMESETLAAFCNVFYSRPLERYQKLYWAEKTPANILQWKGFCQSFDDPMIVHMVRSPYDTVCSLMYRGMSLYQAAAVWLVYTAHGLSAANHTERYVAIHYERFAKDPAVELQSTLLASLHLSFSQEMLATGNPDQTSAGRMQGWRSDERDAVTAQSVGRFREEPEETRLRIMHAINVVTISQTYAKTHELQHTHIREICVSLGYPYLEPGDKSAKAFLAELRRQRKQVVRELFLRGGAKPWHHPVQLPHE